MSSLSKVKAVVEYLTICQNIWQLLHIEEVESISPFLESSFGHVICSDNSTLIKVMKAEAQIFFRTRLILFCCSFGSIDHNVKKFRTAYWRIRDHMDQK